MSGAIWLLPSWGRPQACQAVLDACEAAGMTSRGIVFVDGPTTPQNDAAYRALRLPCAWGLYFAPHRCRLVWQMQWVFEQHPDATAYGWLADDTPPRTAGFDVQLESAAGAWAFAQGNDLWLAKRQPYDVRAGRLMTAGMAWGGDLVRCVGWWAWPELRHACIDVVWSEILTRVACCRFLDDVVIEHLQWKNRKRPRDGYDVTAADDDPAIRADLALLERFRDGRMLDGPDDIARRVRRARRY